MTSTRRPVLSSICPILLLAAGTAFAQPSVLDQSAPIDTSATQTFAIGGGSHQVLYQTITPGIRGRILELRLPIGCASGTLNLGIFTADPGTGLPASGTRALLSESYPAGTFPVDVGAFQTLSFRPRAGVTAGVQIVFVLSNPSGSCGIARSPVGDAYGGGSGRFTADENSGPDSIALGTGVDDLPFELVLLPLGPVRP